MEMKHIKTFEGFLNEGFMSEVDIIKQESKSLQEFIKKAIAAYPPLKGEEKFLEDMWNTSSELDESEKDDRAFEGFVKKYGDKMTPEEFEKLPIGAEILYTGTRYNIEKNNGATIVLKPIKGGSPIMINLNQFIHGGAITESISETANQVHSDLSNKMKHIHTFESFLNEAKLNEYGAKPSADNWLGWFVLTGNLRGDLTMWKKGELVKAYTSDDKGYVFVVAGDTNYEAYDDIAKADFDRVAEPLDKDKHKKSYNYVEKLKKLNQLKDWEKIS